MELTFAKLQSRPPRTAEPGSCRSAARIFGAFVFLISAKGNPSRGISSNFSVGAQNDK